MFYKAAINSEEVIKRLPKGEYVGIIKEVKGTGADKKVIFCHVKYYDKSGIYYGYINKKWLTTQTVKNRFSKTDKPINMYETITSSSGVKQVLIEDNEFFST